MKAIKVTEDGNKALDNELKKVAQKEIDAVSALDHEFICKLIEVVKYKNYWFLIMPKYDGDLFGLFMGQHSRSTPSIKFIYIQILEAVYYMHDKGYYHRDIKLENILYEKLNNTSISIKLSDFGAASNVDITQGYCPGTVGKRSVECVAQETYSCKKHDIWSLAIALMELIYADDKILFEEYYNPKKHNALFYETYGLSPQLIRRLSLVFKPEKDRLPLGGLLNATTTRNFPFRRDDLNNNQLSGKKRTRSS